MSLAERLSRYGLGPASPKSREPAQVAHSSVATDVDDRVDLVLSRELAVEFAALLGGQKVAGPEGWFWLVDRTVPLDGDHGAFPLARLARLDLQALAMLTQQSTLADLAPDEVAFFDTETTGLAGGTGTTIFLAGVARIERSDRSSERHVLRLRQYFLPDPSVESAFLAALSADLATARTVVTFNGGRFDLPLLETRLLLHRPRGHSSADWPFLHVDLLHPSRRLWRRAVENCQLGTLEREVLAARRDTDLPGWEIPARYFLFLHRQRLEPLAPVFAHNASDLVTLAALSARLGSALRDDCPASSPSLRASERLGLASLFEMQREWERAAAVYETALADVATADLPLLAAEAWARLGAIYKRLRQTAKARASWEAILEATGGRSLLAAVEMAKHYEHRERDYARALWYAEQALETLHRWPGEDAHQRAELARRIARLRLRQERASTADSPPRAERGPRCR